MLVQAAVGAALAMFLREWHLEDVKKLQELRTAEAAAAELAAQQEKNDSESESESETESESENESEIDLDNQDIDNSDANLQDDNIDEPENKIETPDDNFNNTVEPESQQIIENEITVKEDKDNETNIIDQNNEPEQEINIPETAAENILPDFQVDDIIDNILSESTSDMPSDIVDQIIDLAASSELPAFPEAEFDGEVEVERVENDTTNITLSPDEYNNDTNNPQNISQAAVEILGENFDFDSLLAESKIIDITEIENNQNTETNLDLVEDKPKQSNYTVTESIDNIPTNTFECDTIQLQETEYFTCESQEAITTFTPDLIQNNNAIITDHNQSFTEFLPPIYKRKNKKH
jgi:hypothetical protein